MKNHNKHIAFEDTCNGDVMDGCYGNRGKFFRHFCFIKGSLERPEHTYEENNDSLVGFLGIIKNSPTKMNWRGYGGIRKRNISLSANIILYARFMLTKTLIVYYH